MLPCKEFYKSNLSHVENLKLYIDLISERMRNTFMSRNSATQKEKVTYLQGSGLPCITDNYSNCEELPSCQGA
jgi:hypothetical protein